MPFISTFHSLPVPLPSSLCNIQHNLSFHPHPTNKKKMKRTLAQQRKSYYSASSLIRSMTMSTTTTTTCCRRRIFDSSSWTTENHQVTRLESPTTSMIPSRRSHHPPPSLIVGGAWQRGSSKNPPSPAGAAAASCLLPFPTGIAASTAATTTRRMMVPLIQQHSNDFFSSNSASRMVQRWKNNNDLGCRCWYSSTPRKRDLSYHYLTSLSPPDEHHSLPSLPLDISSHASSPLVSFDTIPPDIAALVNTFAAKNPTMISLKDLIQMTKDITGNSPRSLTSSGPAGRLARRLAGERGLMEFGQLLKQELPIRLAHRIQDLDGIPRLRDMPSVQTVKGIYIHSFLALLEIENPVTPGLEAKFADLLQQLYQNHSQVLVQMARGAWEFKSRIITTRSMHNRGGQKDGDHDDDDSNIVWFAQQEECHAFLDRFYSSRVGIRVLAGQYLAVRQQWQQQTQPRSSLRISSTAGDVSGLAPAAGSSSHCYYSKQYIGMICQETSAYDVVQAAIQDATRLCEAKFGEAPRVVVRGRLDLTFPYIPSHLHYIVLELLKNALRATVEHYYQTHPPKKQDDNDNDDHDAGDAVPSSALSRYRQTHPNQNIVATPFPDVVVIIADNTENEDVVIKISDRGGGIPRSHMEHIWSYLYTTANPNIQKGILQQSSTATATANGANGGGDSLVLAGLGYGLPMSRAYARYFGGDLDIISMEGHGTDAFVYLARLGDKGPTKFQV